MTLELATLTGRKIVDRLDDLARLRTAVFRDWPYLYDGDPANERSYLERYGSVDGAVLILALDGGRAVGASTAMPLLAHEDASGLILPKDAPPADTIFYLAESVLEPRYRGRGLGHRFFDVREAAGRSQGFAWAGFASVIRPSDHPKRPKAARDLCPFWSGRGYAPVPNAYVEFSWTDIGDDRPTTKRLQYWMKPL